jgi:CBS domain-containing protein
MNQPAMTVSMLMSSPIVSVAPETRLDAAYRVLAARRISSVPVIDGAGKALGVLSLTDLLRLGRLEPASLAGLRPLDLPEDPVSDHMHKGVQTVRPDAPVTVAAHAMVEHRIHRVYVEDEGVLAGVFSIDEVLVAVRNLRISTPIGEVMTKPVITLPVSATVTQATARLDAVGVTGIAIVDEYGHAVGVFTQVEALSARDMAPSANVEEVMSFSLLSQHGKTPLYRAAAHAYEAGARRVFVVENGKLHGLLTGLDFARLLATAS